MRLRHPSAKSQKRIRQSILEVLEPRLLFAATTTLTLHGGDVFEFQDAAGSIEKVSLFGNITAQLIGAQVDGQNVVHLGNLPGVLDGVSVNGGIGTPVGAQPIAPITITDPFTAAGNTTTPAIQALASNGAALYAVNFISVPPPVGSPAGTQPTQLVQLVMINPTTAAGTVIAELGPQVGAGVAPLNGLVTGIPTSAFDPANGLLYFVATAGQNNVPKLFSVNVNAGSAMTIQNSVSAVPGSFGLPGNPTTATGTTTTAGGSPVTAITFDGGGNLVAAGTLGTTGTTANGPKIFEPSLGDTDAIGNPQPITVNGTAITGPVEGLAFYPGVNNPIAIAGTGTGSQVLNVSEANGDAIPWGPLANGATGQNPGGLTFDSGLTDPFTGQSGALLATDTATHQLFYVSPQNRIEANYVWSFYVSQSDENAEIVVSGETKVGGTDTPFTGSVGMLRVVNAQTGMLNLISAPANTGVVYVGALSRHIDPNSTTDNFIPYITAPVPSGVNFGVLPGTFTNLSPGLIVASGNNLGQFQVGGTVTGDVLVHGAIGTFYAGWLLTGNANGEIQGIISDPRNFEVDGEIRSLLVDASIGTDSDAALQLPTYLSGFDMHTMGAIGTVQSYAGSIIGAVNADDSPGFPSLDDDQQELETKAAPTAFPWDVGELGGNPPGPGASSPVFNNDSFANPQYVTGEYDAPDNLDNAAVVDGVVQNDDIVAETVDYYAVPLLAGQTITTYVAGNGVDLGVFDPSGREVYTDYNQIDLSQTQNKPIQFTADVPGLWRFAVGVTGNTTFLDGNGPITGFDIPYQLVIQGVGDTGLGNVVAADNIFDQPVGTPGFGTLAGDFGSLVAGDALISESGDTADVEGGSLRVVQGGTIGNDGFDPFINVPLGNVGLVDTTTGDMIFNYPLLGLPPTIGGDYQMVSSAGDLTDKLVAKGSIGTIDAASMTADVSYFVVNSANNVNTPGTIDLIDDAGDFGTLNEGGPHIITGPHGNVRYITVGGTTYRDSTFGGGTPEGTLYQFGETANLVDDSGSLVNITPEPLLSTTVVNTAASTTGTTGTTGGTGSTTPGTTTTTVTNPDGSMVVTTVVVAANTSGGFTTTTTVEQTTQLNITAYGIEGSGGVVIENVTSTGGVLVNGSAGTNGLPDQSAEIAEIDSTGTGTPTVPGTTPIPPTPALPTQNPSAPLTPSGPGVTTGGSGNGGNTGSNDGGTGTGTTGSSGGTGGDTNTGAGGGAINGGVLNSGSSGGTITLPFPTFTIGGTTTSKVLPLLTVPIPFAPQLGTTGNTLDVVLSGTIKLDLMNVVGGNFTNIVNTTPGEIDEVQADSVGTLESGGSIGVMSSNTPAAVEPIAVATNVFPFLQQHNAIVVGGGVTAPDAPAPISTVGQTVATPDVGGNDIVSISAPTIGNIDVAGAIGSMSGTIAGPILVGEQINTVNIGQGIMASGSGAFSRAGIYAGGAIGSISNTVPADIRGNILSHTGLLSLDLKNGSIINSRIENIVDYTISAEIYGGGEIVDTPSPITHPTLDLGAITVDGNGGIIGTLISFHHTGDITVKGGFGIFKAFMPTVGDGTIESISTDGYGIRNTSFEGGSSVGSIIANGNGSLDSTVNFSSDVRLSEVDAFDPNFNFQPNELTDIHSILGTSATTPVIAGVTDTGAIVDSSFVGNRDLSRVKAYQIRATQPAIAPTVINFSNSIGSITTTSGINGMSVITGKLNTFHPGGDLQNTSVTIAGPIKTFTINGNITDSSSITAQGPNGNIAKLNVYGNMAGSIVANGGKIGNVVIKGSLTGTIKSNALTSLTLSGGLGNGSLDITGSANKITFLGDLGASGSTLTVGGSVQSLIVKGNLLANIRVLGNLKNLTIGKSIISPATIEVDQTLGLLKVGQDVQAGVIVSTTVLKKKIVSGADMGTYNIL